MIWLYRLLFLPALLLAAPYYLWRMRRRGGYGEQFGNRFGGAKVPAKAAGKKRVWLQAVSVGEMLAIGPLLEALQKEDGAEIYLTTTTSTGYRLAKERYTGLTVGIGYFPLDFWWFSARAWRKVQPDVCLLMEGERWPEHVRQAARRRVPMLCVNARLSDRSFRRAKLFRRWLQPLIGDVTRVLCAAARDEERFREIGFPAEKLQTTGNLKLDVEIPQLSYDAITQLRRDLGVGLGLVLLGSSTWPGEEAALLGAYRLVRMRGMRVTLLIVPRHAERRDELREWLAGTGLTYHFRSTGPAPLPVDVTVADTTGELRQLTQVADLVFIGKSLPPNEGGQTPVEAAILARPLIHGPNMSNFADIVRTLDESGAAKRVQDAAELTRTVNNLLQDEIQRANLSVAAKRWSTLHRGATVRTLAVIREYLR